MRRLWPKQTLTELWKKLPRGGDETDPGDAQETVAGGSTISTGGIYELESGATGTITVTTTDPVTIVGKGADEVFNDLNISCSQANSHITIKDLYAKMDSQMNANTVHFTGDSNTFDFVGENVIDADTIYAIIGVSEGATLTVGQNTSADAAEASLYLYKTGSGTCIGGDSYSDLSTNSGKIIIEGGNIFAKGSGMGAVIGNGGYKGSGLPAPGDIEINGGCLNLIANARGSAIGSGAG